MKHDGQKRALYFASVLGVYFTPPLAKPARYARLLQKLQWR